VVAVAGAARRATTMAKGPTTTVVQDAARFRSMAIVATVQTVYPSPITEIVAT
jgi:hypothetical protein